VAEDNIVDTDQNQGAAEKVHAADCEDLPPADTTPRSANPLGFKFLDNVGLRITVDLGKCEMTVREVLALAPGSVVVMDKLAGEMIDVAVQDYSLGRGEVMVIADMLGVRLTEVGFDQDEDQSGESGDESI
jgi:flagellar motor switch protein FliN/FliY